MPRREISRETSRFRSPRGGGWTAWAGRSPSVAEAGDLARDEPLQIAEGERMTVVDEMIAVDGRGAQHFAHLIDDLLRPFADGTDRGDLPRFFALACELDEIVAAAPDAPTLCLQ